MQAVKLRDLPKGAIFHKKDDPDSPMWIKGHYNQKSWEGPACYSCTAYDDINRETFPKPGATVYVD